MIDGRFCIFVFQDRSKALGTYALCGFCSMSTLAIAVGIWVVVCPPRRPLVSKLMIRVMFEANVACFTTACIAGELETYMVHCIGNIFRSR